MVLWLIAGVLVPEPVPAQKETSEVLDQVNLFSR